MPPQGEVAMMLHDIEMLIASAINRATGTYLTPTFGELNKPYFSGNYYSYRSFGSAGYYVSVQTWNGSNGVVMSGDPITVGYARNDLGGGSGNDVIYSDYGNYMTASGGKGNDTIIGREELDASGGDGNDFIVGGMSINADSRGNYLYSWHSLLANAAQVSNEDLHKCFFYAKTDNTLYGGNGDDTLIALGDGNNLMYGDEMDGGTGNDLMIAGNGQNTMYGGEGSDFIVAGDGNNSIRGGTGKDTIYAGSGNDIVFGENGDDYIEVVGGENSISGGSGNDTIYAEGTKSKIYGDDGNDLITAVVEHSTILGGVGDDSIHIEGSSNSITDLIGNNVFQIVGSKDSIESGAGNDAISVEGDDNEIESGDNDDVIQVIGDTNKINSGDGNDVLIVKGINNSVSGGEGNDIIYIANDVNSIDGGNGFDIISYSQKDSGVTLSAAFWQGYTNVEGVIGTAHADQITGTDGDDYIEGGGGQDTLDGGVGYDTLGFAGASQGVDANLQTGVARLADNSSLGQFSNFEGIQGGAFNDTLAGDAGDNRIDGGAGDDFIAGGAGNDTLSGDVGQNTLDGGDGFDFADYSASNDAINVNFATGEISGGHADNDSLVSIEGVIGSAYDDTLAAGLQAVHFIGGAGDDLLISGMGADTLEGGAGVDAVSYAGSGSAVSVDLTRGGQGGSAEGDVYSGIEGVIGSAYNDTLTGDSGDNILAGGDGDDSIFGGSGNDTLVGGAGRDTLDGGEGTNALSYAGSDAAVWVDLGANACHGGHAEGDVIRNFERVIGSDFDDTLTGSNTVATTLDGGAGNDLFRASQAATSHLGGSGVDTVSYAQSDAGVRVDLTAGVGEGGWAQGDAYDNMEAVVGSQHSDTITGNASDNSLDGGDGDDSIIGVAGNNTLRGGAGDDTLRSGSGADVIDGGDGADVVDYSGTKGAVTVDLRMQSVSGGYGASDTLVSIEGVIGGTGNDILHGVNGASYLDGGGGNDTLYSHGSSSTLLGGDGNDFISVTGEGNVIDGGEGPDTLSYAEATSGRVIDLQGGGTQSVVPNSDTILNIEYVLGSDFGDTIRGNSSGNDTLYCGDGNDSIIASAAANKIDGGQGTDTVDYSLSDAGVTISLSSGRGSGGFAEGDTLSDIEVLIGSQYGDSLGGYAKSETIFAGAGNDTIRGSAGADYIDGGTGEDLVSYIASTSAVNVNLSTGTGWYGDAQGDTLVSIEHIIGTYYNDTLVGNADANGLVGGVGNDSLAGGDGDDILEGGAGADTLDGGEGTDIADYSRSTAGVTINLSTGTGRGGDAQGDRLISIEGIIGSDYNDSFIAGLSAASFAGGLGVDTLSYALSDSGVRVDLEAGTGSGGYAEGDTLSGIEQLIGSAFNDTLLGSVADELFDGGDGADSIDGRGGADTVSYAGATGAVNVDLLSGIGRGNIAEGDRLSNIEAVTGSRYNDTLAASDAGSTLMGGGGNNLYIAGAGADEINDSSGVDTVDYSRSTSAVNVNLATNTSQGGFAEGDRFLNMEAVTGSNYNDTLAGGSGTTLSGGAGDDLLIQTGLGAMKFDGGDGVDTVDFSALGKVYVNVGAGTAQVWGTGSAKYTDALNSVECMIGTAGIDTVDFNSSATGVDIDLGGGQLRNFEVVYGSTHDDTIIGSAANEQILGSLGADFLNGGAGTDTLSYASSTTGVTVNLATGTGSGGFAEGDTINGFEHVIGSQYNDTLAGGASSETLEGGNGNDLFMGSAGADDLNGGNGIDTVDYSASTEAVNVNLATNTNHGGFAEGDTLYYIEAVTGSAYNDTLTGGGAVMLSGGAGDDMVVRAAGVGASLSGGEGQDTLDYSAFSSRVSLNLSIGTAYVYYSNTSNQYYLDTISSFEGVIGTSGNDTITGSTGDDVINARAGNDILNGGAGNDTLIGGVGYDTLTGGAGQDVFAFMGTNPGNDVITDFNAAEGDVLAIQTQNGIISMGYIDNASLGTGSFTDNNVLVFENGSNTYVYADMNGDGNYTASTDLAVTLAGVQEITVDNILYYSGL